MSFRLFWLSRYRKAELMFRAEVALNAASPYITTVPPLSVVVPVWVLIPQKLVVLRPERVRLTFPVRRPANWRPVVSALISRWPGPLVLVMFVPWLVTVDSVKVPKNSCDLPLRSRVPPIAEKKLFARMALLLPSLTVP